MKKKKEMRKNIFDLSEQWLLTNLTRYVGKEVTLSMNSGTELSGWVADVGNRAVHLSPLKDRGLFDAVVGFDQVRAMIVPRGDQ